MARPSGTRSTKAARPRPAGRPAVLLRQRGPEAFARYERTRTSIMVGSAVRAARRRAGVSQAELAERAGTSQPSIARLEKGQVSPTVITLDRIARALGTDLVIDFEPQSRGQSGPSAGGGAHLSAGPSVDRRGSGPTHSALSQTTTERGAPSEGTGACTTVARMRKTVAGVLGALLALTVAACGSSGPTAKSTPRRRPPPASAP